MSHDKTNEQIYLFLNSLNAKEGLYRHIGDKELEYYFRTSQEVIHELLRRLEEQK